MPAWLKVSLSHQYVISKAFFRLINIVDRGIYLREGLGLCEIIGGQKQIEIKKTWNSIWRCWDITCGLAFKNIYREFGGRGSCVPPWLECPIMVAHWHEMLTLPPFLGFWVRHIEVSLLKIYTLRNNDTLGKANKSIKSCPFSWNGLPSCYTLQFEYCLGRNTYDGHFEHYDPLPNPEKLFNICV